jgi:hypothetical protein
MPNTFLTGCARRGCQRIRARGRRDPLNDRFLPQTDDSGMSPLVPLLGEYRTSVEIAKATFMTHRDLASRIHVRNAPKADKPKPTRKTQSGHSWHAWLRMLSFSD